uniref:phage virion morphogenesis protein n=1 Tax=Gloeomargarita lithophora TaxID=1188228 RepID=UPI003F7257EF
MANVRLDGLESLAQRLKKPALFKAWGQHLERRMVTAFRTETSPAGQKWPDLQAKTRLSKRNRKRPKSRYPNKILRDTGDLYASISSQLLADGVVTGTARRVGSYSLGAIHQYGAPRRGIPPRPFLPINERGELLDFDLNRLQDFIAKHVKVDIITWVAGHRPALVFRN